MERIGKLLVFLNLIAGIGFLTWSVGLYTERIEWLDRTPEGGEKIEGRINNLKTEIETLQKSIAAASEGWGKRVAEVAAAEKQRTDRAAVYAARLREARETKGYFEQLFIPGSGLLDTAQVGPAVQDLSGKPLKPFKTLETQFVDEIRQAGELEKQIADARNKQAELGEKVADTEVAAIKQKDIRENLRTERIYVSQFQINWDEQKRTLETRKKQLLARIAEVIGGNKNGMLDVPAAGGVMAGR